MTYKAAIVHAFTSGLLKGNPAGVCMLNAYPDDTVLQAIASEINLSETAFIVPRGANEYDLRWFTPAMEVDLCGHATLATAHRLRELQLIDEESPVRFYTLSGILTAAYQGDAITLDMPNQPGQKKQVTSELAACFAVPLMACARNETNYLVEVADVEALRHCGPKMEAISRLNAQGVIVTTAGGTSGYDYAYRYFAPQVGIDEDPVTGSANCLLAGYWKDKLGKTSFRALQASAEGGELHVELKENRVHVAGAAKTMNIQTIGTLPSVADQTSIQGRSL